MVARANAPRAPSERSVLLRRCAAAAAALGGLAWVIKAGVILATGDEPPAVFSIGLLLFPFALLGLWSTVRDSDRRTARVGGRLAAVAAVAAVLALVVRALGGQGVEGGEDEVTLLTPFIALAGFGTFAALISLGIAVRRTSALPSGYASLPLAMGLGAIPLLMLGAALEGVNERLFEIPIGLLGLGWLTIGAALWNAAGQHPTGARGR